MEAEAAYPLPPGERAGENRVNFVIPSLGSVRTSALRSSLGGVEHPAGGPDNLEEIAQSAPRYRLRQVSPEARLAL
jgi:hypothetical protein